MLEQKEEKRNRRRDGEMRGWKEEKRSRRGREGKRGWKEQESPAVSVVMLLTS